MPTSTPDASSKAVQVWCGSLLNAIDVPLWRIDERRRIVELNCAARQLFQLAGDQPAVDLDWQAMINAAQSADVEAALAAALSSDDEVACEIQFAVPVLFEARWFRLAFRSLHAEGAGHIGWACHASDIHEQVRKHDLLEQRDQELKLAMGSGELGFWRITQGEPYLVEVDEPVRLMWGFDAPPARPRMADLVARVHPDDRDDFLRLAHMTWQSGASDGVFRLLLPDGRIRWQRTLALRMTDPRTKRLQVIGVASDVTDRQMARDALRVSGQRLQIALTASGLTLFTMDRDLRFTWVHSAEPNAQGLIGKRDDERAIRPEEARALMAFKQTVLDTGIGARSLNTLTVADKPLYIETTLEPLRDAEGRIEGLVGAAFNVTRQRLSEIALFDSDRRRDDFLSVLAHELRNPLAPIRNALEILRDLEMPPAAAAVMPVLERQVAQMARLVDDLLDVARVTTGRLHVQIERADLVEIARRSTESYRQVIEGAGRGLAVVLPDSRLIVNVDPIRISQVIGNLLNNAAKFSPEGGQVRVALDAEGDAAVLRVIDDGIGFLDAQIPRLFEKFVQLPGAKGVAREGLGVGLHLSRELMELHGGTLDARSPGPGLGSEFTLRLPMAHGEAHPEDVPKGEPLKVRSAEGSTDRPAGLEILVVDDNADVLETTSLLLQAWGHRPLRAPDGAAALAMLASHTPQAVLMDIGMPRMDGFEMARRIRELPGGKAIRLIAMSGWGQPADRERARAAGIDEHLVKPVDPIRLRELLDQLATT